MSKLFRLSALFALLASLLGGAVTYTPVSAAGIRYVKPMATGIGNCKSWANACTLQTAIASSLVGDQIWVQAGTYIPHPSDRKATFTLKNELQIYGGFNGTETQFAQRDLAANVTILSGDLKGNDGPNFAYNGENSYHVVRASQATSSTTILDGFTIRGGNANADPSIPSNWENTIGGGMYNKSSSPTLRNLTFSSNYATRHGGGMYNDKSSPSLRDVTFSDNSADENGGGMHNDLADNLTLMDVWFLRNKAAGNGGGMSNNRGSATLTDVTFSDNSAIIDGGGMNNYLVDSLKLTRVTFDGILGNSAKNGGGLYNNGGSATLTDVQFLGNKASENGGGMYNQGSPMLTDVTFSGNSAKAGGGMHNYGDSNLPSNPVLINATFGGNKADVGGGMFNNGGSATLTNVNFLGNKATENGGGMFNNASSPKLTDVTFRGNAATNGGGMYNLEDSNPTLTNVTFDRNSTNSPGGAWGGGMFNKNSSPSLTNVTFSSNKANKPTNSWGGGMFNESSSPSLTNVTFSGNEAAPSGGGGIYSYKNILDPINHNSQLTLTNTIIASSTLGGDCIKDAYTSLNTTSSNNLIEDPSNTCVLNNGENGNTIGVDPNLGPLANNGGHTQTHALLAGSPAINKGEDANCPATDQRGQKRPIGNHCDIGAYELVYFATIAGNVGASAVTLSYTDDKPKTVTSQPNGNYSLNVVAGWSGKVTPSHPCLSFNPANRTYNSVLAHKTAENYTANLDPAANCTEISVKIGGITRGTYWIPPQGSLRESYAGIDNGPVIVNSTNSVPLVASERVVFPKGGNNPTSFSEMMGLPANQVGTRYVFPAYDNINFNSQIHIANIGNSTATVRLLLRGKEVKSGCTPSNSPFTIAKGMSIRVSCGENEGPLVVDGQGVLIAASLRIVPKSNNGSFSEIMGIAQKQAGVGYVFPWYNNATLNSQLRVANVGTASTTVTVTIAGVPRGTFPLNPNIGKRIDFAGVTGGPVRVTSSGNVPIVASMRVLFPKSGVAPFTSYSETMGIPQGQLATTYHLPWYNNVTLDAQLRVANLSASPATVHILIGGQEMAGSPFTLAAGAVTAKSFAGINKGPVKVESNQSIVASLRILLPKNAANPTYFSEVIGLPQGQLTNTYYFPWYNNVTLDTQIRIGVP